MVWVPCLGGLGSQPGQQAGSHRLLTTHQVAYVLARGGPLRLRARDVVALLDERGTLAFEPVTERLSGAAVVLVVALDGRAALVRNDLRHASFERALDSVQMRTRLSTRGTYALSRRSRSPCSVSNRDSTRSRTPPRASSASRMPGHLSMAVGGNAVPAAVLS